MVSVDKAKCKGCRACINVCPQKAIYLLDNIANIDGNKCVECGKCISVCPVGALSFSPEKRNIDSSQISTPPFVGKGSSGRGFERGRGRGNGRRRGASR